MCDSIEHLGTPCTFHCTFQTCIILDIVLEAITETQDNNGLNKLEFISLFSEEAWWFSLINSSGARLIPHYCSATYTITVDYVHYHLVDYDVPICSHCSQQERAKGTRISILPLELYLDVTRYICHMSVSIALSQNST